MSDYSSLDLTEQDIEEYVDVLCFAISKGTANVSASDRKKLHGLLRYYAKKKHPFTACVRDNRKRFGAHTEEYCAVLKDLIVGNTKWRGKGKKYTPKNLSEDSFNLDDFLTEIEVENLPEDFLGYLSSLTDEDIALMTNDDSIAENLASAEIAWQPEQSFNFIRKELQQAINELYPTSKNGDSGTVYESGHSYWVDDVNKNQALVCHKNDYWLVGYKSTKKGMVVDDQDNWQKVEQAWVQANFSEPTQFVAEMFFDGSETTEEDGFVWKTIMREGTWKYSPGAGQVPVAKPIHVVSQGESDYKTNKISLQELMENFENKAKEHVTIPTSHENKVLDNTGYIRKLRIGQDDQGRATLEAACDFTEPEVKEKALRGTIPNTSAGIKFDYIKKDTGDRFNAVLDHVALTPNPWLNGMKPFGMSEDEDLKIISFSEEDETGDMSNKDTTANNEGGVIVSTQEVETTQNAFFDEIGLSEDEIKERLNRLEAVEAEMRKNRIESKCATWKEEGKSPAVIAAAQDALLADTGEVALNLSEDGKTVSLTLSDVVERLVAASPTVNLDEEIIKDQHVEGEAPKPDATDENNEAKFSEEEKTEIAVMMFDQGMSEEAAIAKVLSDRKSE